MTALYSQSSLVLVLTDTVFIIQSGAALKIAIIPCAGFTVVNLLLIYLVVVQFIGRAVGKLFLCIGAV